MGWGRMDDGFDDHPKVVALLDHEDQTLAGVAVGVWTLCWTWAHRNTRKKGKTPGLVPPGLPRRFLGPVGRQSVELLVRNGLWHEHESGGWLFHDFDDYLPTEGTREARSEAGRRGAERRWAAKRAAEETPEAAQDVQDESNFDGKLPSVCHDADGKPIANDGSRAPARRDPIPTPIPNTQEHPSGVLFGEAAVKEPPKPKKREAKPLTRIPDNFTVTDTMIAWARENTPLVDGKWQTAKFIDYWKQATRNDQKKDWAAAWRTWMRNAQERAEERGASAIPSQQNQPTRRSDLPALYPDRNGVAVRDINTPQVSVRENANSRNARGWLEVEVSTTGGAT